MRALYIYDVSGWAFENLGRLWFADSTYTIDFKVAAEVTKKELATYDRIWLAAAGLSDRLPPFDWQKTIVTVHDPVELFQNSPNWKNTAPSNAFLEKLRKARVVTSISKELQSILSHHGIASFLTPTMGSLPLIDTSLITTKHCRLCAVNNISPRKNLCMLFDLQDRCHQAGITFDTKIGFSVWPRDIYQQFLDDHEIYICTSFQEGGPLCAMEAMARGQVVITTPVGQLPEIITHGKNGFIASTEEDFFDTIKKLDGDRTLLHTLRVASRQCIEEKRAAPLVREQINLVFDKANQ